MIEAPPPKAANSNPKAFDSTLKVSGNNTKAEQRLLQARNEHTLHLCAVRLETSVVLVLVSTLRFDSQRMQLGWYII